MIRREDPTKDIVKKFVLVTAVVAAPFLVAGAASAEGEEYELVSHAPDSGTWWNETGNGIALAGDR